MVVRANDDTRTDETRVRRFTRSEYERMAAQGILAPDERVELVEGEILVMTPQGSRHTTVVHACADELRAAFGAGFYVRIQSPLAIDPDSEPEPDVAVVIGSRSDYADDHPKTAVLVVEVADSTLLFDRRKARVYARAKVQEYWIANLVDGVVEVHRMPVESVRGSWSYSDVRVVKASETVQPVGLPNAMLKVSSLLS
jgi:Uma2 family endonuclease